MFKTPSVSARIVAAGKNDDAITLSHIKQESFDGWRSKVDTWIALIEHDLEATINPSPEDKFELFERLAYKFKQRVKAISAGSKRRLAMLHRIADKLGSLQSNTEREIEIEKDDCFVLLIEQELRIDSLLSRASSLVSPDNAPSSSAGTIPRI